MARPPINTGSSALQAYMQGVANMGQVRAQMQANTTQAINALGDTFTKWQDDFNKRKHLKWTQQMEEAKLAETQRVNDSNIKVNEGNLAIKQAALPHEIAAMNANTDLTKKKSVAQGQQNYAMGKAIKSIDDGNAWGQHAGQIISGGKVDNPNTPTPNSNGAGDTTPQKTQPQGLGGWFMQGVMTLANKAKQQKQAAAQQTPTLAGS